VARKVGGSVARRGRKPHYHQKQQRPRREYPPINHDLGSLTLSGSQTARSMSIGPMTATIAASSRWTREIASVSARATEVFGSREKALRWLDAQVPSLGNQTPLSLLSTSEGIADVEDALGAIEHGIW
jgi:Protein of unknown function (DUF2384)